VAPIPIKASSRRAGEKILAAGNWRLFRRELRGQGGFNDEKGGASLVNQMVTRKEATRRRIVETASRLFLEKGVDGVGVDEIMRESGLTHGGFYVYFPSKEALVAEACLCALDKTTSQWEGLARKLSDEALFDELLKTYLSGDLTSGNPACPMAILGPDVARRDAVQHAYIAKVRHLIDYITAELHSDRAHAILSLAALVGATSLAAQVGADRALAEEILKTTRQELLKCRPAAKKKTAKAAAHSEADA
jgi:TetR/AcrR family transcriptional repressor of nem operon